MTQQHLQFQQRTPRCFKLALICFVGLSALPAAPSRTVGAATPPQVAQADEADPQSAETKTDFLGDPLPPHALARMGTNRFCPPKVTMLALSPDESIVVTYGPKLMAWDAKTGQHLWSKASNAGSFGSNAAYGFRGICRTPKSGRLATTSRLGAVDFWDFQSGEFTTLNVELDSQVNSIDVSPDETLLALGGARQLIVCDLSGAKRFAIDNKPSRQLGFIGRDRLTAGGEFSYARFSPDGRRLVLVNSEKPKTLQVVDVATGRVVREIETNDKIVRIGFSPDGKHVATTQRDIAARMYDLETGQQVWENIFSVPGQDERYTTDISFSPEGDLIAVGTAIGEDHRIQLLDPGSGDSVGALTGHSWKPWFLQFTANGREMYSCGWDSVVRRWDIEKREQIRIENSHRASGVCSMAPDGKTMLFCDDSGKIHIVDPLTGKKTRTLAVEGVSFSQVIYSQDSRRLAGGGSSQNDVHVYVWDLASGAIKHHWEWPKGNDVHSSVEGLSFSRDANRLAACVFRQSACYVFDLSTDEQIAQTRHGNVYGLSLSPDGQQLVSAGWDKQVRLWDCESGKVIKQTAVEIPGNDDPRMYGVLFAPDGKSLATLSLGGRVRTWDLELEQPTLDFKIESRAVYGSFQYSRNGLWLAVGRMDGGCTVYDVHTGEVVWDLAKHTSYIYNVDFGADDRTLLTGGEDGVCYLWDLNITVDGALEVKKLVDDLVDGAPQAAFVAHQALANHPQQAIPAIQAATDAVFDQWGDPDETQLAELNYRVNRVAMWLAEIDLPEAGELMDHLIETCPSGSVKKTIFLASKHRKRFLERVEMKGSE